MVLMANSSFFCLLLMYLLTSAFTIQTKTLISRAHSLSDSPHTNTHPFCIHYGFLWENDREYLYISITQNIHFRCQVNTFIRGGKRKEWKEQKEHLSFLRQRHPPARRVVRRGHTELGWMWRGLAEWHLSSFSPPQWLWLWERLGREGGLRVDLGGGGGWGWGGVTAGRQQQRAPGCSGHWWQQTGLASQ